MWRWFLTGLTKNPKCPRRTEHPSEVSGLPVGIFWRKVSSGSNPYGHGSSCHPWQRPPVANVLFAPPWCSTLFEKISPPPDKHLRKDIPSTVGILLTDSTKIHRITGNSGIIVVWVNNFLHNCRKDLKQRNCFFYRTFFYSISTIFISLRLF